MIGSVIVFVVCQREKSHETFKSKKYNGFEESEFNWLKRKIQFRSIDRKDGLFIIQVDAFGLFKCFSLHAWFHMKESTVACSSDLYRDIRYKTMEQRQTSSDIKRFRKHKAEFFVSPYRYPVRGKFRTSILYCR